MTNPFEPASFPVHPIEPRATSWRLRTRTLEFKSLPMWMGIVNVTPDSFSDGGRYATTDEAVEHALQLADEGADILDIGGESTRPYSEVVGEQEELDRVVPVVEKLISQTDVPISVDTSKSKVARAAMAAGAEIINDITGLEGDPEMINVVVETEAGVCAMHMQGTPQTMQDNPQYDDLIGEIRNYLATRRHVLLSAGVDLERICLDPGIGFGKTHEHNLTLAAHCGDFHSLGCPLLVGHSRKGFLAKIVGDSQADRSAATVGVALALARQGVQVIRVHEVRPAREAVLAFAAVGGLA
ncbi:dihydropteroate synthase [Aeoliella mucimassa]|uniref:Dihydropteroate synthase n=1 Tax=Aeoliella mucimassa TaxID=2527972 RepID=A0A518AVL0_9BACT|nr:dihydropteroate synthase [Aeoliella mucimassa]QDU58764.1 Dihydropteroate synthase [Aeoliella mucimassa]